MIDLKKILKEWYCLTRENKMKYVLKQGQDKNEIIFTNGVRCVGKTTALFEFAKENNYGVIVLNKNVEMFFKSKFQYPYVYFVKDVAISSRGQNLKGFVFDEGVDYEKIPKEINIITGFTDKSAEINLLNSIEMVHNTIIEKGMSEEEIETSFDEAKNWCQGVKIDD